MFNPNRTIIEAFVVHTANAYREAFASVTEAELRTLETATQVALEALLQCDCPYHDLQHTMLVTDAGQAILKGRQLAVGDLSSRDWLQAVVAMLFHDIGYLRSLLAEDTELSCLISPDGARIEPAVGGTDALMTPYHVDRGKMYVKERFARDDNIDVELVAACIEMTRFPVPSNEAYADTDTLPGLVRAADLIGQIADPQYLQKLSRLFAEFAEIGEAERSGLTHPGALRNGFPEFFYTQVYPYIGDGIRYLKRTQQGQQWVANIYHHLHVNSRDQSAHPRHRAPELIVDNLRA